MMRASEFTQYLKSQFSEVSFFTGAIDANLPKCVGVYSKGRGNPVVALGGAENSSYNILPISILVHWTENADSCEQMAQDIYEKLRTASGLTIGGRRVIQFQLLDSHPENVGRTDRNIVEMVIRLNIFYEREVM